MNSHAHALNSFARKLSVFLMIRGAVRWATVWFFVWGVVVLVARVSGVSDADWLLFGILGAIPLAVAAALWENRKRSSFIQVRAAYDGLNRCGGVVMAEEAAEMSSWHSQLPKPASPRLRWRGGRSVGLLTVATLFVLVALLLPSRFATFGARRPLEIGKLVGELHAEVEALEKEKILEPRKAEDLQKQLARLKEQSSALDPNKTWEALDHIKSANSDLAHQAAEEAVSKTTSLTQAETLASALQVAADSGLSQENATRAAQDLAGMLQSAKLEDGLLKAQIPPELLSQVSSLSKEDLAKLLAAIQSNKSNLGKAVTNLANLRMIDPKLLSQCQNAGQCRNPNALAEYICACTNACDSFCLAALAYCRGIKPGGPGAPMTWKDESSGQDAKFKEQALPPSSHLSGSQFVGVSRTAPQLSDATVVAAHGALDGAQGSGGSANAQIILPEHRQAVQNFFKRDEK